MLIKHELPVAKEETERCDTMRYSWERLNATAAEVQTHLLAIQPNFKSELISDVKVFITDCDNFYGDYDQVCSTSELHYFFGYKTKCFSFQHNLNNLDPSYKTDLDLWDCLGRVKLL